MRRKKTNKNSGNYQNREILVHKEKESKGNSKIQVVKA